MTIEWDALTAEMTVLALIIYGSIYVGNWLEKRKVRQDNKEEAKKIIMFVSNDLTKKLRFIDELIQHNDFKPIFTDMLDAVLLGGKQGLLSFEKFENLQHTYSWIKYYNNELEQMKKAEKKEAVLILKEVRTSMEQSLSLLNVRKQSQ